MWDHCKAILSIQGYKNKNLERLIVTFFLTGVSRTERSVLSYGAPQEYGQLAPHFLSGQQLKKCLDRIGFCYSKVWPHSAQELPDPDSQN